MNTASTIIKNLILPLVVKSANKGRFFYKSAEVISLINDSSQTDILSAPDAYWDQFANDFINFETDASPIYSTFYKLKLRNPEDIFKQLPEVYSSFINELAEEYVLGNQNEITTKLLESKNVTFLEEVSFFSTMKAVITKTERNQLKKDLPQAYERLLFELDEETLRQIAKKKSREDLRVKFEQWDEEMVVSDPIWIETNYSPLIEEPIEYKIQRTESKVISLSWIKYAVAACIVLTAGVLYFKFNTTTNIVQPGDTNVVTTGAPKIETYPLAAVSSISESSPILNAGLGFASKEISIITNNQEPRKLSIVKAIEKYQMQLQKNFPNHKDDKNPTIKKLNDTIVSLQKELQLLENREKQYVFNGKSLTLYLASTPKETHVLFYEDSYYLKKENSIYKLTVSEQPQNYSKETNEKVVSALDKILFDNGH